MPKTVKLLLVIGGGLLLLLLLIQLVPYGRDHTNPPVVAEPQWDSPRTRELFMRACGDCHSNQSVWPGYSNIAPISWLVQYDVAEGREHLNISVWGSQRQAADEAFEVYKEGEMPPKPYLLLHPEARLSGQDQTDLLNGLLATFGSE